MITILLPDVIPLCLITSASFWLKTSPLILVLGCQENLLPFNIADQSVQSNVAAATSILAGLVLEKGVIQRVLRKDIMQESVIYQEIREEALVEGVQRVAVNLLREGMSVDMIARVTGLTVEQIQQLQATDVKNQQE